MFLNKGLECVLVELVDIGTKGNGGEKAGEGDTVTHDGRTKKKKCPGIQSNGEDYRKKKERRMWLYSSGSRWRSDKTARR